MTYLEDVLLATQRTRARTANAKVGTSALVASIQARNLAKEIAAQNPLPGAPPAPARMAPGTSPTKPHSMSDGHNHGSAAEVKGLNAEFNAALQRMIKDSGGSISIGSGYRSMAQQQVLYDRYRRGDPRQKAPAAAPGKSNHNHGLAADLKYGAGGREFAHKNAAKYGLVFPMSYEPWHIEPVNAKAKRKK